MASFYNTQFPPMRTSLLSRNRLKIRIGMIRKNGTMLFGVNRIPMRRRLCTKIKHLAIAGKLSDNAGLLEKAKQSLLEIAAWDPEGTTSEPYNDEAAFRVLRALAWGYDWLYDQMEEEERRTVRDRMLCRAGQVFQRDVVMAKIHQTPYESHPVRSLSMVLIPCGIALLGDVPEAEEWLNYSLEYLACLYSPWGGEDGGWAEGGAYWTTGMASVVEGLDLVQRYLGIDLLQRPFFQHTGDFILHCYSPKQIFASFCDQSNLRRCSAVEDGIFDAAVCGNYRQSALPVVLRPDAALGYRIVQCIL